MSPDATLARERSTSIPTPEPGLTVEELVRRAEALRPLLRERQSECEALGELPADTNARFLAAGFYRILQPRLYGGYEFTLPDFMHVMMAVARGCSDSAWVLALTAGHTVLAAQLAESAQREVFGPSGDFRAPGVGIPGGTGIPENGGFRVSGAWDYASGCDLATHYFGSTMVRDPQTNAPLGNAWILFDRDQFSIVNNWNVIGMQGTGSRRVVIENAFAPADRALWFIDSSGRPVRDQPGHAVHPNPMYHGWIAPLLISEVAAVCVGAARGALDIYEEILKNKKTNFAPFQPRSQEHEFQQYFGEAQSLIDTGEAALLKMTADYMDLTRRHVATAEPLDDETEKRLILVEQQIIRLAWDAVELMFRTSGTSAASKTSALGRTLRNLAVIRTHVTLQHDHTATNAGRLHFGLPPLSRF
jgi:3-hydroxy-9,10-secoandrosta-1,3,5(10)-triene-9,17-dione monooxygenase